MLVERTVQVVIEPDEDLSRTLHAFTDVCNTVSPVCYNDGRPLQILALQRKVYHWVKGRVSSQITCTTIRLTAGAYVAAKGNGHEIRRPFKWHKPYALFPVGKRDRDADFRRDGRLSIWTVTGSKRLNYHIPEYFKPYFEKVKLIDSIVVREGNDKLIGYVALKVEVREVRGVHPVGVNLNETNILVGIDADGRDLFISGLRRRVLNKRDLKTIKRLQRRLAQRKAEGSNTRSVVRALKRLAERRARRTRDFCHLVAKRLVDWAPENAVLVFERLDFGQGRRRGGKAWNRRFHQWPRGLIVRLAEYKVQGKGVVAFVDPRGTSKTCSRCGLRGIDRRHVFRCQSCGFEHHADLMPRLTFVTAIPPHGAVGCSQPPLKPLREASHPIHRKKLTSHPLPNYVNASAILIFSPIEIK